MSKRQQHPAPQGGGLPTKTLEDGRVADPSRPTPFGRDPTTAAAPPFVHPGVTDPRAVEYGQQAARRRAPAPLPKYAVPVAGGPAPHIPNLSDEAQKGMTMADQSPEAISERIASSAGFQPKAPSGGIIDGGVPTPAFSQGKPRSPTALPAGILVGDILPDEATKDPAFRAGAGSMLAASQPALAYKYGVLRKNMHIPPQQLRAGAPGAPGAPKGKLRAETVEDLKTIESFQRTRQAAEAGTSVVDAQIAEDAARGPAGKSEAVSGGKDGKLTEAEMKDVLESLDAFDISSVRNRAMRDLLNNDEQKKIIEDRLKPLDIVEMVTKGRVSQLVPIVPGSFEPTFQSYTGEEDLTIKRLIVQEAKSLDVSDRYFMDKYSIMGLTISLKKVNDATLPNHEDENGNFDEEKFWEKYAIVSKFNYHMLSSLFVNWFWFDMRVRKLFKAEDLGNG